SHRYMSRAVVIAVHRCAMDVHPLIDQLRFTRSEFLSGVRGVSADDAKVRLGPMNCLAWNVGHLAWQEQRYFVTVAQARTPRPDIADRFRVGGPASQPDLDEVLAAWREITAAADEWLAGVTSADLPPGPTSVWPVSPRRTCSRVRCGGASHPPPRWATASSGRSTTTGTTWARTR